MTQISGRENVVSGEPTQSQPDCRGCCWMRRAQRRETSAPQICARFPGTEEEARGSDTAWRWDCATARTSFHSFPPFLEAEDRGQQSHLDY